MLMVIKVSFSFSHLVYNLGLRSSIWCCFVFASRI